MKKTLTLLLVIWLIVYIASFVMFASVEPTGSGFTRGLNRVSVLFGWQISAGLIGLFIWVLARGADLSSAMRWLTRLPICLAAALFLLIVGLILWANFSPEPPTDYQPPQTTGPTTEPAIPVPPPD